MGLLALGLACLVAWGCGKSESDQGSPASGGGSGSTGGSVGGAGAGPDSGSGGVAAAEPTLLYSSWASLRLYAVHVDGDYVYWTEPETSIMRGLKDGSGEPEFVGPRGGSVVPTLFVSDDEYVYWLLWLTGIRRYSKSDGSLTDFELDPTPNWSAIDGDGEYLYAARDGCTSIARVRGDGSELVITDLPEGGWFGGGTYLTLDDQNVYCGSGPRVYRMPKSGGAAQVVVTGQETIGGMATDRTALYWLNCAAVLSNPKSLHAMELSTGEVTDYGEMLRGGSGPLCRDEARNALYWVSGNCLRCHVMMFDVESRELRYMARDRNVYGAIATDEDFVYWTEEYAVMRMHKDGLTTPAP